MFHIYIYILRKAKELKRASLFFLGGFFEANARWWKLCSPLCEKKTFSAKGKGTFVSCVRTVVKGHKVPSGGGSASMRGSSAAEWIGLFLRAVMEVQIG